ncbi:MAG: isochorismate synthase [Candidatus Kryptoniota bacterium]
MENQLKEFLKEISRKVGAHPDEKKIVAFSFRRDQFFDSSKINSILRSNTPSFYMSRKSSKFKLLAVGKAIEVSTNREGQFDELKNKISQVSKNFVSNIEGPEFAHLPLFVGGRQFYSQPGSETWKDFPASFWFIPKLMIVEHNGMSAGMFTIIDEIRKIDPDKAVLNLLMELNRIDLAGESKSAKVTIKSIEGDAPADKKRWADMVKKSLEAIENQKVKKVVISRKVEITVSSEPDFYVLTKRLENDYPDCHTFVFHSGESFFFGATPERLASFSHGRIYTDALAGSAPRGKNIEEDTAIGQQLLSDSKNLAEQKFVVDYIKNSLLDYVDEISVQQEPQLMKLANIQHLHSKIAAKLKDDTAMLSVVERLHPTPAVCGQPRESALELLTELEEYQRGMYAGIIGWFNFKGDGEFAVAIRSALAKNNKVTAFAGCGIVKGSQPEAEFNETKLKLKPILSLFEDEN